jgi:hypothetical protein
VRSCRAEIGIVAHVDRLTEAAQLADDVDAMALMVDDGTLGCEGNHVRTWRRLANAATPWVAVLEDDAQPVRDFGAQLDGVLAHAPTPIVSLYLGRSRPPIFQPWIRRQVANADAADACYIIGRRLLHCVGLAIRTPLITDMVATVRTMVGVPIDEAIHAWAEGNGHDMAYCWPSIVDHHDGPTLVAHRDGQPRTEPRVAWCCGSRNPWHDRVLEA